MVKPCALDSEAATVANVSPITGDFGLHIKCWVLSEKLIGYPQKEVLIVVAGPAHIFKW